MHSSSSISGTVVAHVSTSDRQSRRVGSWLGPLLIAVAGAILLAFTWGTWPDPLTDSGREFKRHLEDSTDRLSLSAFDALDDDELELLFRTLTPLTRKVVAAGDVPAATPMGLRRDDLDDDGAQLS